MPKSFYWCAIIGVGFLASAAAAFAAPPETFRVVHLQVLESNGRPAVHRDVELRGFDRRALGAIPFLGDSTSASLANETAKAREAGWLFTTDENGEITARIGNFAGWKDAEGRPGWGSYIFTVRPGPDDAGATSPPFWNYEGAEAKNLVFFREWGAPLPLPPQGFYLTIALQEGYTLYGQLVDDRDHRTPAPNIPVVTWNDLHVDTHTGYGGQIFNHSATTDANGEFEIHHLYCAKVYLRSQALWMTTDRGGQWLTQNEDVLDPPEDRGLRVTLGVAVHPDFHYAGRVTDAQGHPVAQAEVVAGILSEPAAVTYADTHHFERTTTDANGNYDLAASSPWGTFLEAEDKVHGRVDLKWPGDDTTTIPPGKYNLAFPATPNPSR